MMSDMGAVLRAEMDSAGIRRAMDLSRMSGVPKSTIYTILQNRTERIRPATAEKLAEAIGCPVDRFVLDEDKKQEPVTAKETITEILAEIAAEVCDKICRYPYEIKDEEELYKKCAECPLERI